MCIRIYIFGFEPKVHTEKQKVKETKKNKQETKRRKGERKCCFC